MDRELGRAQRPTLSEAGELAASADPQQQVYLTPAFTGLGAPHWDSEVFAAIFGLTRGATRKVLRPEI